MNKIFKVIWSAAQQSWVAVSELSKGKSKSKSSQTASTSPSSRFKLTVLAVAMGVTVPAQALTIFWSAGTGDWATAGNWNSGVPTSSDPAHIDNGGTAQITSAAVSDYTSIGNGSSTTGTVTVDGSGASLTNTNDIYMGNGGTGTLRINNGGAVSNRNGYIGYGSGSGTATVDGSGSSWTNSNNLYVGNSGTGTLTISNGGSVSNDYGFIGNGSGSTGTVTVDGGSSSWTNSSELYVGLGGTGTLTVSNGGSVSNTTGYIGSNSGSTGTATVTGSGSSWTNSNNLYMGFGGTASLTISDGGTVANNAGVIGYNSGITGTVTVTGTDSRWTNSSSLYVGRGGTGTLTISNGGQVSNNFGYIGEYVTGEGTVSIDGAGSSWTNSGNLFVGYDGAGALTISGGATASTDVGFIGNNSGSTGTAIVTGNGSSWTNSSSLYVGNSGTATLTISNGGTVSSSSGSVLGGNASGTGTVTITGSGSSWAESSVLYVGDYGTGTLTVSDAAEVSVASGTGSIVIAHNSGSTGTLNIGAAYGDTAIAAGTLNAASVGFVSGTGSLVFNHTNTDYIFTPRITGAGAVGLYAGTTRFTGDLSSHTGTLTVNGGTLSIADGETLTLGGNYSQTAGTLKLGASSNSSYGKLAVTGTATFAADSAIDIDVSTANTLANGSLTAVISAGTLSASTFTLTDNSALFDFTATINGNQVDLTAQKTANIVDSVTNTGFDTGTDAAQVLDDISAGSPTGDMQNVVTALGQLENDQQISDAVADTMPLLVSGTTPVITNNMHNTNRVIQARQTQADLSGKSSGEGFITDKHLWLKPIGSWTQQNQRNGVSGYDADSYGVIGGIDGELNDSTTLGFAASYINTDVEGKGNASGNRADIDAYQAIVYGSHDLANNDIELNWQADVGINKNEGKRHISFMNRTAKADYDSYTTHIGVGAAKTLPLNDTTTVVPSIRADYTYIKEDSYSETGAGALNLNVDSNSSDELIVMAQSQLNHQVTGQTSLTANAGIGYDLLNDSSSLTASYSGGGAAFTTEGIDPSPWLARVGAGVTHQINDTTEITAHYDLEGRSDFLNQTASVKLRWAF